MKQVSRDEEISKNDRFPALSNARHECTESARHGPDVRDERAKGIVETQTQHRPIWIGDVGRIKSEEVLIIGQIGEGAHQSVGKAHLKYRGPAGITRCRFLHLPVLRPRGVCCLDLGLWNFHCLRHVQ